MDKEKEENEKDVEEMTPEELEAHNKMVDEIAMKVFLTTIFFEKMAFFAL